MSIKLEIEVLVTCLKCNIPMTYNTISGLHTCSKCKAVIKAYMVVKK